MRVRVRVGVRVRVRVRVRVAAAKTDDVANVGAVADCDTHLKLSVGHSQASSIDNTVTYERSVGAACMTSRSAVRRRATGAPAVRSTELTLGSTAVQLTQSACNVPAV